MLIALNAATRGVCVISHAIVFGAPAVIATAGFAIVFALTTDRIKGLLKTTKKKKKKQDNILNLAKSNSITLNPWYLKY